MNPEPATIQAPSMNYSSFLEQVIRDYNTEPALGLAHALQKEAIQNTHGARDKQSKTPWATKFELREYGGRLLLTITDEGTVGLGGTIYPDWKNLPENIPPEDRLARFENMFDSGGNFGAGLFGRGKLIFNACSKDRLIYYDTLTRDGKYRFGKRHIKGRNCEQFQAALEGEAALKALQAATGGVLKPLLTPGTRITLVHPIQEVVQAVRKGHFLDAIEETWWEIIQKDQASITVADTDGTTIAAKIPAEYGGLPRQSSNKWRVYYVEHEVLDAGDGEYKVKRLHMLVPPDGHKLRDEQLGIYVHRRGMKVGKLQVAGLPDEIAGRFFGYIQLDSEYESVLASCENTTHYGFSHMKRPEYKALKKWTQDHFSTFMTQIGYGPKKDPTDLAKQQAEEAQSALNNILSTLGVPNVGSGTDTATGVFLTVEGLEFPRDGNFVKMGDEIEGFQFVAENGTPDKADLKLDIYTHERELGILERFVEDSKISINPGQIKAFGQLKIKFQKAQYPTERKIGCTAVLRDAAGKAVAAKSFYVFLDIEPVEEPEFAEITLVDAEFPKHGSKRVNFGQSILGLDYRIENKTGRAMKLRLKVRTIWAAEGSEIEEVLAKDLSLAAYGSASIKIDELKVTKERYGEVGKGKIKIRCAATALEATKGWPKAQRLAEHTTNFWLEADPSYGMFEDTGFAAMGPKGPRSKALPTAGTKSWRLDYNSTHPAYEATEDDTERRQDYLFEELAKQSVFVLLRKGHSDAVRKVLEMDGSDDIADMEAEDVVQEIAYRFTDRLLAEYYG